MAETRDFDHPFANIPAIEEVQHTDGTVEVLRDDRKPLMPDEAPDFEKLALDLILRADRDIAGRWAMWTEQLRLVWNARGAADIALIHAVGEHVTELIRGEWGEDSGSARELTEALDALRALDR